MPNIVKNDKTLKIVEQQIKKFDTQNKKDYNKYHVDEGDLILTNGLNGVRIEGFEDPGVTTEDPIPPVEKLLSDFDERIRVSVEDLKRAFTYLQSTSPDNPVNVLFSENKIVLSPASNPEIEVLIKMDIKGREHVKEQFDFNINPRLMQDAFMFFDKLGIGTVRLSRSNHKLSPIKLSASNIEYLIAPVRVN